jgi:molecular chaperone GrpE (heat shock protein)
MTDAPETIWARVKPTVFYRGTSREVSELREWCEGYATPEIAETCNATQYTRTDIHDTAKARIAELEAALEERDERIEGLEAACEIVSSEFEGDLWVACRSLLTKTHFDFSQSHADGVQAADFEGHMNDTLYEFDRAQERIAELEAALAASRNDALQEAADACSMEILDDGTEHDEDMAYDHGVSDCLNAILALALKAKP